MRNLKALTVFILALLLAGCATPMRKQYATIYYNAMNAEKSLSIVKEGSPKLVQERVKKHLETLGYKKVIYQNPKYHFTVVGKQTTSYKATVAGTDFPCQIIYKFSTAGKNATRIDLVRASDNSMIDQDVDWDIEKAYKMIERD